MADKDWRVTAQGLVTADGTIIDSTFCIRDHTAVPLADPVSATTLVNEIDSWLSTLWRATMITPLKLDRWLVRELGTSEPDSGEKVVNGGGTIAAGGGTLPVGACVWVSAHTDLHTRSGRGGFHFPPPLTSSYLASNNFWGTGTSYWSGCNAVMGALLAGRDFSPGSIAHHLSWRIWSHKRQDSHDVTSATLRTQVKFVRTRMSAP